MNLTPNSYLPDDNKDRKESSAEVFEQGLPDFSKKPRPYLFGLLTVFKAGLIIYSGLNLIAALSSRTLPNGYPVWMFIYAFFNIALGIGYLGALVLIGLYKRLGLILMATFVAAELTYTFTMLLTNMGQLNSSGITLTILMLSRVLQFLNGASYKDLFT